MKDIPDERLFAFDAPMHVAVVTHSPFDVGHVSQLQWLGEMANLSEAEDHVISSVLWVQDGNFC